MAVSATVVIPTWRRRDQLASTLDALGRQDTSDFEVVVVSDGDDPDLRAFAQSWMGAVATRWIFHDENRGLPAARNTGADAAEGGLLLFLDDDVVPGESWVKNHIARHEVESEPVIVLGNLIEAYDTPADSKLEFVMRNARERGYRKFFERVERNGGSFEFAPHCGNNSSVSVETFRMVGGFDIGQRLIHEDLEMGERARSLGVRFVYEPLARAVHHNSRPALSYESGLPHLAALSDLRRARDKGQRTERTVGPVRIYRGPFKSRTKDMAAFAMPALSDRAASVLIKTGAAVGSDRLFDTGRGLKRSVEYWNTIKEAGEDRASLKALAGAPVSALVVHAVSDDVRGEERRHHIGTRAFARSIQTIAESQYEVVQGSAYVSAPTQRPRVMLTFDDAYEDFYSEALPLLVSLGLTATVYVVAGSIGMTNDWDQRAGIRRRRIMNRDQLVEIHRSGIEIGSHSMTHPRLTAIDSKSLEREVVESKELLEDLLGSRVTSFAYPAGQVDERVRSAVARAGYTTAFTTIEGLNHWTDPLLLNRASLSDTDSSFSVRLKLRTGRGVSGHGRRLLIAAAKAGVSILPSGMRQQAADAMRRADNDARTRMWKQRTIRLAEDSAQSGEIRG